jgi:NAD(P)-dependent dehydrogenase (short-subunit alcohol dehydrogenase family)
MSSSASTGISTTASTLNAMAVTSSVNNLERHSLSWSPQGTKLTKIDKLFDLSDRVALVTGGGGLYGRPISTALAEAGATVIIASRDQARCERLAAELQGTGLKASSVALDLADEASIQRVKREIEQAFGRLDVLVNGAVHRQGLDTMRTNSADWQATSRVNSLGLFLITQACIELMVPRSSGSIINISSIYGVVGPTFSIYGATGMTSPAFYAYDKGGMIAFTRYLASEYGPRGIRVNSISPGGLFDEQPQEFVRNYTALTPLGRMASTDDIKGAVVFLASDASGYVTGVNLMVDGGWTAH